MSDDALDVPPPLGPGEDWVTPKDRPYERLVVRQIPEEAPPVVREGLARRRVQAVEGVCPCGGRMVWPTEDAEDPADPARRRWLGQVRTGPVAQHIGECPAGDAVMIRALEAWRDERSD